MTLKVGDEAIVVKAGECCIHQFIKGEIVTITEILDDLYRADSRDDYWWVDETEVKPWDKEVEDRDQIKDQIKEIKKELKPKE